MTEISLLDIASLPEFFREKVNKSIHALHIDASEDAEFYLVNLLTNFTETKKLFEKNEKGELVDQALALRLFDAAMATPNKKGPILKKLGDVSLYVSGFFADSLFRKIVSIDYYIQMGGTAYSSLSMLYENETGKTLKELFDELSSNFLRFVDVLSDVADNTGLKSDQNLLKLYERWLQTGSERARTLLTKEGIILNELVQTKYKQ